MRITKHILMQHHKTKKIVLDWTDVDLGFRVAN
jgi:hypothetical protein